MCVDLQIEDWLMEVAATFPDLAEVENIGQTYEGRNQILIKVWIIELGEDNFLVWGLQWPLSRHEVVGVSLF